MTRSRVASVATATLLAGCAVAASAGAASADTFIKVRYPVTGSTTLAKPNATVSLGPGTLKAVVDANTGKVKATLTLPPATGSFTEFGIIPVTATTQFINVGPTTGTVNLTTGAVQTTSKIKLRIVSLSVAGIPIPVGPACESVSAAVVHVKSQKGFSLLNGGNLKGSYALPNFGGCGLITLLLNLTLPGPGNTITLTLGKAKIG